VVAGIDYQFHFHADCLLFRLAFSL